MKHEIQSVGRRLVLGALATAPAWGLAESRYPSRPVRLIVPWNPGGSVDIMCRQIAKLVEPDGLQLIVESTPGATGTIGMAKVAAAPPDGYMVGSSSAAQLSMVAQGMTKTRNDQFTYLTLTSYDQFMLLVPAASPVRDVQDFMKMMKDRPGAVSIGGAGSGGILELWARLLGKISGGGSVYVPYTGGAKALMDLAGSQIDGGILKPAEARSHIEAGTVRPVAIFAKKRLKSLPNVPTFAEKGVDVFPFGNYEHASWMCGPANMPPDVTAWLIQAFGKAVASKEYQKFMFDNDITASDLSGDALRKYVDQAQEVSHRIQALMKELKS